MTDHIVLGGTGAAGRATAAALLDRGQSVAVLSRGGGAPAGATGIAGDLLDPAAVLQAVSGSQVAYLTAGLPYSTRIWRRDWPRIVANAVDACVAHGVHLVYFDNVYAYGATAEPMTEATPIRPTSRKGAVRAAAAAVIERAGVERGLVCSVARSADFYGPRASTSVFTRYAADPFAAGRKPTWLVDATKPHSMTYVPDIGTGLAVLGTDTRSRGGVWHLPTAPALTGDQYLDLLAGAGSPRSVMSIGMMRVGGVFMPAARESVEMAYQYTLPYRFDSSAFEARFGVAPTPIAEGIAATLAASRAAAAKG